MGIELTSQGKFLEEPDVDMGQAVGARAAKAVACMELAVRLLGVFIAVCLVSVFLAMPLISVFLAVRLFGVFLAVRLFSVIIAVIVLERGRFDLSLHQPTVGLLRKDEEARAVL